MKKLLALMLAVFMTVSIISLAACTDEPKDTASSAESKTESVPVDEESSIINKWSCDMAGFFEKSLVNSMTAYETFTQEMKDEVTKKAYFSKVDLDWEIELKEDGTVKLIADFEKASDSFCDAFANLMVDLYKISAKQAAEAEGMTYEEFIAENGEGKTEAELFQELYEEEKEFGLQVMEMGKANFNGDRFYKIEGNKLSIAQTKDFAEDTTTVYEFTLTKDTLVLNDEATGNEFQFSKK